MEDSHEEDSHEVVIIGAGMAGLGMAARLKLAGRTSFVVLEKADAIGGTWRDNTYPGAACDVQSHLYWYSFGEQPDWSRLFAGQPEILHNIERFADSHGLAPHIRFGTEVTAASWSDEEGAWTVRTSRGTRLRARVLVTAWGQLNQPSYAGLPGREAFTGTAVHTARWPRGLMLAGKRVACVGTGASAVQVVPAIAAQTARLTVFQRSPNYLLPREDRPYTAQERRELLDDPGRYLALRESLYRERDGWAAALRRGENPVREQFLSVSRELLERQVPDPGLREKLWPDYEFGCKRVLVSDDYYPALMRDNVELVTEPVRGIEERGVRTADGNLHEVDVIVYATGFKSLALAGGVEITGRDGRSLREIWQTGPRAYLGMAVSGFPNLFMLYGPGTNLGHHSILFMVESQIGYVLRALGELDRAPERFLDVRPEVLAEYDDGLQAQLRETAFAGGCNSWYKTGDGRVVNNWPADIARYRERTAGFTPEDYAMEPVPRHAVPS